MEKQPVKEFVTKVDRLGVPKGTRVIYDPNKDNIGISGRMLCSVPAGGALFYAQDELEEVAK